MSSWAEAHNSFSRTDRILCGSFCTLQGKIKSGGFLARGKSEKDAEELVDTVDRERADFIQKYFDSEWPDRPIYHGMLNTAIGDECVANMILSLVQTYEARCTP